MINLSAAITNSEEWGALSEEQRASFLRRLTELKGLALELKNDQRWAEAENFESYVEDLELDVSLRQEYDAGPEGGLTRWLTHYSWVFSSSPAKLRLAASKSALTSLDQGEPASNAPLDEYKLWFKEAGGALASALDDLSEARAFDGALACLFLVDIIFSRVLIACYKLRFHPALID